MSMLLHWSPRSPFVRKVMVFAHETGLSDRIATTTTRRDKTQAQQLLHGSSLLPIVEGSPRQRHDLTHSSRRYRSPAYTPVSKSERRIGAPRARSSKPGVAG